MGTIKRIHVDQHAIRRNAQLGEGGEPEPTLTIQNRGRSTKAYEVEFSRGVLKQGTRPLSCGARVWIETRAAVIADGRVID